MIVIMRVGSNEAQVANVVENIKSMGLNAHIIEGEERTVIAVVGEDRSAIDRDVLSALDGVERMMPVLAPYKIASREVHPANTIIPIDGTALGDKKIAIFAGPRLIDRPDQLLRAGHELKALGVNGLVANIFGAPPSPYWPQGLGEQGLEALAQVRAQTGLPIITEVTEPRYVQPLSQVADILVVSGRNMQNYTLLNAAGESQKPIIVKRGIFNTMEELLMAAEYILARGNRQVILCEGGIRTSDSLTHNTTFDVNALPVLREKTYLPLLVDVSRAAGCADFVPSIAKGAIAAGTDGLLIEVDLEFSADPDPQTTEAISITQLATLLSSLRRMADAVSRTI